jgi:phosphodiesterase/alkaline phosphatase D-like protein
VKRIAVLGLLVGALAVTAAPSPLLAAGSPTASTGGTSSVTATSVALAGTVDPQGSSTSWSFQYGTTTAYGSSGGSGNAGSGTGAVSVVATLGGLSPATTYHYRLVATNGSGTTPGADATFTTAMASPSVTAAAASAVTGNSAVLNATVNPNGNATSYVFQYGVSSAYGLQTASASAGSGTSAARVSATVRNLTPGTNYHFRVLATNALGSTGGADTTFPTSKTAPSATTGGTSVVRSDSAVLTGTVNPNGVTTTYEFDYGSSTAYGSQTNLLSVGAGTSGRSVTATIAGLSQGTPYHYRLVAISPDGTTAGADAAFTTTGTPADHAAALPVVSGTKAVAISSSGAQLDGALNPPGKTTSSTTWYFEYGLSTAYGTQTAPQTLRGLGARPVNVSLAALAPATTFHYRLVAQTPAGRFEGPDGTFRTKAPPRAASAVTIIAAARVHRRFTSVAVSGALRATAAACNGSVLVQIVRGSDTISLRSVGIRANCTFSGSVAVAASRLRGVHRLTVRALFTGNATLLPATSRAHPVHV